MANGLVAVVPAWERVGPPLELVQRAYGEPTTGSVAWTTTKRGPAISVTDSQYAPSFNPGSTIYTLDGNIALSAFVALNATGTDGTYHQMIGARSGFSKGAWSLYEQTGVVRFTFFSSTPSAITVTFTGVAVGTGEVTFGVVRVPGGTYRLYKNGLLVSTQTNGTAPGSGGTANHELNLGVLTANTSLDGILGDYHVGYVWRNRILSGADMAFLHANPFGLVAMPRRLPLASPANLENFRFYDEGTESGSTPAQAEETNHTLAVDGTAHLRGLVDEFGGGQAEIQAAEDGTENWFALEGPS